MDARALERTRPPLHAVVGVRAAFALLVALVLVTGLAGGLLRAGVALPPFPGMAQAVVLHAALMMSGFFGTVIGIERAVSLKRPAGFAVPLLSALAAVALWGGQTAAGSALGMLAATGFVAMNIVIVRRQPAFHTCLLGLGALAWWCGQAAFALDGIGSAAIAWWAAFLVLTVVAERLEMTRLMRRRPGAQASLQGSVALLSAGAALSATWPAAGCVVFGAALAALALWLLCFDIARRTVRTSGLSRYMAVCLLSGHAWLLVAGVAWAALGLGQATRDLALHALGLGFLFGMVMGHAPVILPAVARVKVQYGPVFYGPWALLQVSLLVRFAGPRVPGVIGHVAALAGFVLTLAGAAGWWRLHHGGAARSRRPMELR
jgi:hypothetical protein